MKRTLLALLLAGCSGGSPSPAPAAPGTPRLAASDSLGRWGADAATLEHWLYDPQEKKERDPSIGAPKSSLYRDTLPFPQFSWGSGDFEVTQLVFPAGDGFMARYHVMNHGSEARAVRLLVGSRDRSSKLPPLVAASAPSEKSDTQLAFDLTIEPGASQFVVLSTPEAAGRDPREALEEAAARWERLMGRTITLPDAAQQADYCRNLAGRVLGTPGCAEAVHALEARFAKREGNALRLFGEVPEAWLLETIEIRGLKTDFGPLTLKHTGFYNNRMLEFEAGCAPPDGFLMTVGTKHKAKIDGKEAQEKDGVLRIPSGTKRVELARPH